MQGIRLLHHLLILQHYDFHNSYQEFEDGELVDIDEEPDDADFEEDFEEEFEDFDDMDLE